MEEDIKNAASESLQKQTQALAKPKGTINNISDLLKKHEDQIQAALPKHLTAKRLIRVALTAMSKNPALLECTPKSLFGAVIQAAELGLEPDSPLGHAYMIPFNRNYKDSSGKWHKEKNIQFIIGYRGMLDLVRRSGQIDGIVSMPVYENDEFSYEYGTGEHIKHVPTLEEKGNLTHVYAYAKLKDGGFMFEVMTKKQVDAIRARSKASETGAWVTDYIQMARKTLIIRLCKYLPLSIELARAVELSEADEAGKDTIDYALDIPDAEFTEATPKQIEEKPKRKRRTKKEIEAEKEQEEEQPSTLTITEFTEKIEAIDNGIHLENFVRKYEADINALPANDKEFIEIQIRDKKTQLKGE